MKITIDNHNGSGPVDYSAALGGEKPLRVMRKLNEPSICTALLHCTAVGLAVPVRTARVVVSASNGTILFTGYLAVEPESVYAGQGLAGAVYTSEINAISDEWLLDQQPVLQTSGSFGQTAGQLLETLTARVDATRLLTTGVSSVGSIGVFQPDAARTWSQNAGTLAAMARATYRALNGNLSLQPVGVVTHALNSSDGTLNFNGLTATAVKMLANDITLAGEIEPAAYAMDYFLADGATTQFDLTRDPFSISSTAEKILSDDFTSATLNEQIWNSNDPGAHLSLSGSGFQMNGGNGFDGQTTLTAINLVEVGGELVIEAGGVQLNAGSIGVLCGLYFGVTGIANCFAGFNVTQSSGNTILTPLVNGAAAGTSFTVQTGHTYLLRLRIHCAELQRILTTYYSYGSSGEITRGGGLVAAPAQLLFEVQDSASPANLPSTILYDGSVANSAEICFFGAVNSIQLFGSVGYFKITQPGTAWVVSTPPGGSAYTRRIGLASEGADCKVERTGKLSFYKARIPVAGELICCMYRIAAASVARIANAASIAAESSGGLPGTARFVGKVTHPAARSTADCENAATAMLDFATDRTAAWSGKYATVNLQEQQDVWPGDVLEVQSAAQGLNLSVVVRSVRIDATSGNPEVLDYSIAFANDWAEELSLKVSSAVPTALQLPRRAAASAGNVLANLIHLSVSSITATAIFIDAGVAAPAGGGFEVRRRDGNFGPGIEEDLVLRSPVESFSIPRAADQEQYFIRMYDASTPPLYSRFSIAVFTSVPAE